MELSKKEQRKKELKTTLGMIFGLLLSGALIIGILYVLRSLGVEIQ